MYEKTDNLLTYFGGLKENDSPKGVILLKGEALCSKCGPVGKVCHCGGRL